MRRSSGIIAAAEQGNEDEDEGLRGGSCCSAVSIGCCKVGADERSVGTVERRCPKRPSVTIHDSRLSVKIGHDIDIPTVN